MKKELLFSVTKKDFDIQFFSGTGAGGQHRNKHQNCVRMTHPESGVTATGQTSRSREGNLRSAFKAIADNKTFKAWLQMEASERLMNGQGIRDKVRQMMKPENLRIETVRS